MHSHQPAGTVAGTPDRAVRLDLARGRLTRLTDGQGRILLDNVAGLGLLRFAWPTDEYPAHFVDLGLHGQATVTGDPESTEGAVLAFGEPATEHAGRVPVSASISVRYVGDELRLRATVTNNGDLPIPQVLFPRLPGLLAVSGEDTRLQLGGRTRLPFRELAMRVDDARYLDVSLTSHVGYGALEFNMKWLDYGDPVSGVTVFSRTPGYRSQGLTMQRPDRLGDRVDLHWSHHPVIDPGRTWTSEEYTLLVHEGDWYVGARAYQQIARELYPYRAPTRIREALGIRSVWPAVRNSAPSFPLRGIADFAAELTDPALGLTELVVWHWWRYNGYPIEVDDRLGTDADLRAALADCATLGVPVSLFVSHRLLRDRADTPPELLHHNVAGQQIGDNWTYGDDLLPKFAVVFLATHAMTQASALSPDWRRIGLDAYRRLVGLGAAGLCFDQFRAWFEPDPGPAGSAVADAEGDALLEFAERAREIVHSAVPDGTFSGEYAGDVKVPVLDYTWEWRSSFQLADSAPFRYVFPAFRLNANVNEHPRGALIGFMEGALLNVIPGQMHSHRLADHPELTAVLRRLAALRRDHLRYFTDGQFRFREGLQLDGADGRVYSDGDDLLLVIVNPSDRPTTAEFRVDSRSWSDRYTSGLRRTRAVRLDGSAADVREAGESMIVELGADDLVMVELVASAGDAGEHGPDDGDQPHQDERL